MFAELSSSTAQMAAVRGVAREQFKDRQREADVFEAIMVAVAAGWKRRNPLAHHLWAYSEDLDDALLLIDPRDDVRLDIERDEATREAVAKWMKQKRSTRPEWPEVETKPLPLDRVMVYRENDFEEMIRDFNSLAEIISDFSLFAGIDYRELAPSLGELYDQLEAQPLIAPSLHRLRERRKNAPSAQPQSLPKPPKPGPRRKQTKKSD